MMRISQLYGRKIISAEGMELGNVQEIIIDAESGEISHLLLISFEDIKRKGDVKEGISKSSVLYKRVRSVGDNIIVSNKA
jgi:sporulation protein YlmC with PRC-barrel domain